MWPSKQQKQIKLSMKLFRIPTGQVHVHVVVRDSSQGLKSRTTVDCESDTLTTLPPYLLLSHCEVSERQSFKIKLFFHLLNSDDLFPLTSPSWHIPQPVAHPSYLRTFAPIATAHL